ncbi:MAG: SRPBCC family protein [Actinobacteria bacterium]|nr:MAG: SRPBCC family protein [Actinomycetota bacterium]
MHGTLETIDDRPALRFERRLAHPVDAVWRAVTEPAELAHWFPSSVSGDVRVGGRLSFTFETDGVPPMEGEVLALEPPRRFIFVWGEDELRFDLEPAEGGEGTVLRFTCVLGQRDKAARDAAGWHVCLDRLERQLAGTPAPAPGTGPTEKWREHYEEYARRGFTTGAPIPGA